MSDVTTYSGWPGCVRLANDEAELVLLASAGPRILRFALAGGANVLWESAVDRARGLDASATDWRVYGGHRLWCAPEDRERTYVPDNVPVAVEHAGVRLRARTPANRFGIASELSVMLEGVGAVLEHVQENRSESPQTLAAWAITCMAPGGIASASQPPRGEHPDHLLPNRRIVLWPYADMADARVSWGPGVVRVKHDAAEPAPFKVGFGTPVPVLDYAVGGMRFTKRFSWITAEDGEPVRYPDLGCNATIFTNAETLELESLAPLVTLAPGERQVHEERWSIAREG